jgi:hypothetical protein
MPKEKQPPYKITLPAGTEINGGTHEDGDPFLVEKDTHALVVGPLVDNALPIQIIENGQPVGGILFFHQPEQNKNGKT